MEGRVSVVQYESWCEVSNSLQREGEMSGYWLVLAPDHHHHPPAAPGNINLGGAR